MRYPRWTVVTKRRRLKLRRGLPRLERTVLTEQANAIDVGAWLDEYHADARARGRFVPYTVFEAPAAGIEPFRVTNPTSLINFAREAHDPRTAFRASPE